VAVVDGDFKTISLSDYKGKYVVLFFCEWRRHRAASHTACHCARQPSARVWLMQPPEEQEPTSLTCTELALTRLLAPDAPPPAWLAWLQTPWTGPLW
jgi:hypothetical protein